MATIRELRTKFEGSAKGLKAAIQGVRKDLNSIGTESEKATKKANKSFDDFEKNINKVDTSLKKLDKIDGFKRLQNSIRNARDEVQKYGKISETTLKSLQKNISASETRFDRMGDSQRENFRDVEAAINETKRELNALAAEGVISMKVLGSAANDAADEIDDIGNNSGFDDLADDVVGLNDELVDTKVRLKDTNRELESSESGMQKLRSVVMDTTILVRAFKYSLVGLIPAAVPVFSTLTTSAMGFVSALGAGVAGLGGFAAVAIPSLTSVFEATEELEKAQEKYNEATTDEERDKALEELNQIYAGLTEGQLKAVKALQDFKNEFGEFRKQYDGPVAGIFAKSLETLMDLLKMFSPVIDSTIDGINNLMSGFDRALQTKDVESFFGFLSNRAGPSLEAFGGSFGYVLLGVMNLMTAFSDEGQKMEDGLLNLTKRFAEWTSNIKNTDSFRAFIDYTNTNGPLVLGLFSNLWDIISDISVLLAPIGTGMLVILDYATEGLSKLTGFLRNSVNTIKDIWQGLASGESADSLLQSFGPMQDEIKWLVTSIQVLQEVLSRLRTAFASLFSDDKGEAKDLMQQLGLSDDAVNTVLYMADLIRTAISNIPAAFDTAIALGITAANNFLRIFDTLYPYIAPLLSNIVSFVGGIVAQIVGFWKSDGQQIIQAARNAFGFVLKIVQFAMPAVMAVVDMIWSAIQNIIQGGLKFIQGAIQLFTGIFTGDFSKMWQGIKNIFLGAIQLIWGWINLSFFGRIIKGAALLFNGLRTAFAAGWQAVRNLFTGNLSGIITSLRTAWSTAWNATSTAFTSIWNFLKNLFQTLRNLFNLSFNFYYRLVTSAWQNSYNFTMKIFRAIWNFLSSIFTTLRNAFNTSFNFYVRVLTNGWQRAYDTTARIFRSIWNFLKSIFVTIRDFISGRVGDIYRRIKSSWDNTLQRTKDTFRNVYNTVRDWFGKIVDRAKELPGKIADGISKMASKVKGGITSVINTLASTLGKGINGVIGGVNWVLGKIGVDSKVPEWEVPQYKRGTKPGGHPGGPAIVGDGGKQELIETPDGRSFLSPDTDTLVNMPKGTKVYSGNVTEDIMGMFPAYKFGDKLRSAKDWVGDKVGAATSAAKRGASWVWDKTKQVAGKAKDIALDVWDYASNPSKLLDKALDLLGVKKPSFDGILGNMVSGFWKKIKSGASNFIKDKFADFGSFDSSAPGNVKSWISAAISRTGVPTSWLGPLTTIAMKESGGRTGPSTINNWDINAKRGTPSMGLMQTIRPTFDAFKAKGWNDIMNPIHNAAAAINYIKSRYGNVYNVPGIRAFREGRKYVGYADGGIVDTAQLAWIAEGGWAESIISHDPAKRARSQALWEETGHNLGFFDNASELRDIIDFSLLEKLGQQQVALLMELLDKDSDLYVDGKKLAKILADYNDEISADKLRGKKRGTR